MTSDTRAEIIRLNQEGVSPHKIAWIVGASDYSVRYVLNRNGERKKSADRVNQWNRQRRTMRLLAQALEAM